MQSWLTILLMYDITKLWWIYSDITPPWVEEFLYVECVYLGIQTKRLTWGIIVFDPLLASTQQVIYVVDN